MESEGRVEEVVSPHRLFKTALAIPTMAALAAASYAVHGSLAAVGLLYGSLWRRHQLATRRRHPPASA